jgi:hypothetical protein
VAATALVELPAATTQFVTPPAAPGWFACASARLPQEHATREITAQ